MKSLIEKELVKEGCEEGLDSPDSGNYSCIKACLLTQRDHLEYKGLVTKIEEAKESLSLDFLHVKSPRLMMLQV
jgi:hypothetical protein